MVSSRKLSRREFCANLPLLFSAALRTDRYGLLLPDRKFNLGDRVISEWFCDDAKSENFGGTDSEKGIVIGFCWNYDEWSATDYQHGWTYFVRYYETNNPILNSNPWTDFEHESRLEKI